MYLTELTILGMKRVRNLVLNFEEPSGPIRKWTVLIGPNGTGKTSILQAIAMTAVGPAELNNLANEVREHAVDRRGSGHMMVTARWRIREGLHLASTAQLSRGESSYFGQSIELDRPATANDAYNLRSDPLAAVRAKTDPGSGLDYFVAAYGLHRFIAVGRPEQPKQPAVERLRSVFSPTTTLMGPHFLDWLPDRSARRVARVCKVALSIIGRHLPGLPELELRGQGGVRTADDLVARPRYRTSSTAADNHGLALPLPALAHGVQSILSWVTDIVGQFAGDPALGLPAGTPSDVLAAMRGTILIDEIDLHLHPTWQAAIVPALRATFPNMQFIVSTHSPIVLAQVAPHEIVRLDAVGDAADVDEVAIDRATGQLRPRRELGEQAYLPDPRQMSAGELMQGLFGMQSSYPNPHARILREYLALATAPESASRRVALRRELAANGIDVAALDVAGRR